MAWYNYLIGAIGEIIEMCIWASTIIMVTIIIKGKRGNLDE